MSSCIVHLDNYQGQYYAGNTVVGRVVCSFTSSKTVRGIKLKLRGREHTEWTKSESYYDNNEKKSKTRTVHCTGDNKFFYIENMVAGAGDLSAGRHEYQFSFNLPKNLPGTYHGKYGWVKFSIKATVDRPYKTDYEDEKEFTVVSLVDFNAMKDQLQLDPVVYSDDKTLCCCCCASGPITMNVHLEKEAFIQGETAKVKVEITNMSNENVESVSAQIGMRVQSKVTCPSTETKNDFELLAADNDSGVGAHGERTYEFELEIPKSTVIPNFILCTLFEQHSTLKITAVLSGCHTDMELEADLVMGHIPIAGQLEQFQNVGTQQAANPMFPPAQNTPYPGGMPYPPSTTPYPPNPSNPPLYPTHNNTTPYPPQVFPGPIPHGGDGIGFQMPQATKLPPADFPPLPYAPLPGVHGAPYPPSSGSNSAPYPTATGPSAPPMDDRSSAPTKEQLAEGGFEVVEADTPLIGERSGEIYTVYGS